MELTAAVLSAVVPLVPAVRRWLDSVALRNRSSARAEIIRARSAGQGGSRGRGTEREGREGNG